jgi:hypothetical protein
MGPLELAVLRFLLGESTRVGRGNTPGEFVFTPLEINEIIPGQREAG